eukprot:CAMPEP_0184484610 /NCGR_PEP_ID=MMETSP0113_2-20130426/6312_1 /TAXON_ID=91329 /ORGANISM="Norrisiella sphaerica, Strain BC52" /LENGTH=135 /DNA_ID=CAMNT_0026865681 /DNA_START=24 /DNA_END=431 /DNA_ORIENTATION=+
MSSTLSKAVFLALAVALGLVLTSSFNGPSLSMRAPVARSVPVARMAMSFPSAAEVRRVDRCLRVCAEEKAKINEMIDLESPKVVNMEDLKPGEKKVYCRCWKSGTFPLCDGTHAKWNKETGDNVGPLIVTGKAEE